MKPLLFVTLVLLTLTTSRADDARASEVLAAERARINALIADDFDALEQIFADDLIYVHSNTKIDSKASFLDSLRSKRLKYKSLTHSDQRVRCYGDTAILTGQTNVISISDGKENLHRLRFTLVYVFEKGRWRFTTWQSTRLP
ncbi:MAG TPA: nuclear transport factor 2 family protein [Opitutaceae bacterium]|nr:nuclear transport factor 2 family protein [Opitutaceae bacterium]